MEVFAEEKGIARSYEIQETFDAGIVLAGFEVKAIRAKKASIRGAVVKVGQNGAYLLGAHIAPYQPLNTPKDYRSRRPRKLLLTAKEMRYLTGKTSKKGLTLLPLSLYTKGAWIKLKFALAKPLKKRDKREKLKEKEFKRRKARLEGRNF